MLDFIRYCKIQDAHCSWRRRNAKSAWQHYRRRWREWQETPGAIRQLLFDMDDKGLRPAAFMRRPERGGGVQNISFGHSYVDPSLFR